MKKLLIASVVVVSVFAISSLGYMNIAQESTANSSQQSKNMQVISLGLPVSTVSPTKKLVAGSKEASGPEILLNKKEKAMMKRIAMAEAEDEDLMGKILVMNVVWNRVQSDEFPNSINKVIFQKKQFSPVSNGRYYDVTPNEDCQTALKMFQNGVDKSRGALYFESKSPSTWHSDNLKKLFQHGRHIFYKDR